MKDPRPGITGTIRRYLTRLRRRGPIEVARAVSGAARSKRRSSGIIRFLERPTEEPAPTTGPDLILREATPVDAEAYARDIATDSRSTFVERLAAGTTCFLALDGDRIVHASWVTTSGAWIGELGRYFCPDPGSAYVYESFTAPATRGRGVYPSMLRHIALAMRDKGVGTLWIGAGANNIASLRSIEKAGFIPAFDVGFEIHWGRIDIPTVSGPRSGEAERLIRRRLRASV